MFVLDTNVISETERARPDPTVMAWFRQVAAERVYTAAPVVSELVFGALQHPDPGRAAQLMRSVDRSLSGIFHGRVLPFDEIAARVHARLKLATRGRNRPAFDLQIASIALSNDMTLVTRNTADFDDLGLMLLNPWLT